MPCLKTTQFKYKLAHTKLSLGVVRPPKMENYNTKNAHLAFNRCEFHMGNFARYTCGSMRSEFCLACKQMSMR